MTRSSCLFLLSVLTSASVALGDPPQGFIIQFREPPVALRSTAPAAKASAENDESLARFRSDFLRIEGFPSSNGAGARIHREFFRAFHGASVELTRKESIDALSRLPYVARIYPDLEVEAFGSSAEAVERPAILRSSAAAAAGAGVVVAIIDTGIDYNHPALGGGIGPGRKVIGGYDFVNDDADPMDDNGHGTHVAGILAADGPVVNGVAPGVSILAYKILDAGGRGKQSDVIAGIEAALDPNGDGSLADHADVANLSLGSPGGSPDDPVAEAAENAVAAGMIVCAAVGNGGTFHQVSSPAVAPSVIGVGASDAGGNLASFSSRGPATRTGAIKPDIVAPGVNILSTAIGGGTRVLSGTSMSTPYVSGLAAILVAQHRAWTPLRIKSAIANTATPIPNEEVMSQGVGRVDGARAAVSSIAMEPTEINFGFDALGQNRWSATQSLMIRNDAAAARTFQVTTSGAANPTLATTVDPATVTLGPGESGHVAVTIAVDNTTLPAAPSQSFAFSGVVTLASPQETVRVPWAFLKAARALVRYDLEFPMVTWIGNSRAPSLGIVDLKTIEYFMAPGQYDLILTSISDTNEARMIIREKQRIEGDVTISLKQSDASHTISLDARDDVGAPFPIADTPVALYVPRGRLIIDTASGPTFLELPMVRTKTIYVSDVSEKFGLLFSETWIDGATRRIFVAQHELMRGVTGDRVLVTNPGSYRTQPVSVRMPAGSSRHDLGIVSRDVALNPSKTGIMTGSPIGVLTTFPQNEWVGTLSMTPEVDPDFATGIQLLQYATATQELPSMETPTLRLTARGFISTRHVAPPPSLPVEIVAGDRLAFLSGPAFPYLVMHSTPDGWGGQYAVYGTRDELRSLERAATTFRVTDAAEQPVVTGSVGTPDLVSFLLPRPGRYTARFISGNATTAVGFDTNGDGTPPTLTSLSIRDAGGNAGFPLRLNGTGSLTFSVADYVILPGGIPQYRRLNPAKVSVSFRPGTAMTWTPLSAQEIGEDSATCGAIYVADLAAALRFRGDITLRFELVDDDGNSYLHTIDSAFTVDQLPRRRAVQH